MITRKNLLIKISGRYTFDEITQHVKKQVGRGGFVLTCNKYENTQVLNEIRFYFNKDFTPDTTTSKFGSCNTRREIIWDPFFFKRGAPSLKFLQ